MDKKYIIGFIVGIMVIVSIIAIIAGSKYQIASKYDMDSFAQCLTEKKAVFYGAFWCTHCQNTKKLFGKAQSKLPYVECSTPDGKGQLQICIDEKIEGYPMWVFADGSRLDGELTLEDLSKKTDCPLIPLVTASSTEEFIATSSINK